MTFNLLFMVNASKTIYYLWSYTGDYMYLLHRVSKTLSRLKEDLNTVSFEKDVVIMPLQD